jgi:excisionase family DNA binding protein
VLTVKQVAERLGVSVSFVYAECTAGRMKHRRLGASKRMIRVSEEQLAEYLAAAERQGVSTPLAAGGLPKLRHLNLG